MPIFTIEISGRSTLAYAAPDHAEALAFVRLEMFRTEMMSLRALDGAPLWDGKADITVRPASEEERQAWEKGLAEALEDQVFESREDVIEGGLFAFLTAYADPTGA